MVEAILRENRYLTLATTDGAAPWAAPLAYVVDDDLALYVVSATTSRHARDIAANPRVSVAVFDSHQPPLTGRGVQIDGLAHHWSDDENPFNTIGGDEGQPSSLSALGPGLAAYRITPQRFSVPDPRKRGLERLEVDMALRRS